MPLLRAVSFEGTAAALLHCNHDDDVDFMKEVYCALSKWIVNCSSYVKLFVVNYICI